MDWHHHVHCDLVTPYGFINHWQSLVQFMACRLFGAEPLPEPLRVNWNIGNRLFMKFEAKHKRINQENVYENLKKISFHTGLNILKDSTQPSVWWSPLVNHCFMTRRSSGLLTLLISHDHFSPNNCRDTSIARPLMVDMGVSHEFDV